MTPYIKILVPIFLSITNLGLNLVYPGNSLPGLKSDFIGNLNQNSMFGIQNKDSLPN